MEEYIYYFYNHLNPNFPAETIIKAIETKNWSYFKEQSEIWGEVYLPNHISVFDAEDNIFSVEMNKENFSKISYAEYECG